MKVALVYDRLNKWGGAERVLLALHKIFPDAPLYTSLYDKRGASWAKDFEVKTSFLQSAKALRQYNDLLALFMPLAFESLELSQYDLVISVTSEAAKGIITKPGTVHICYCLTPTRYLWSGYEDYFKNDALRFFSSGAVKYLRFWDKVASSRPDQYIAISGEVKKRITKYYGRDSRIVYPPVFIDKPYGAPKRSRAYLLVSRFSRFSYYKKVDLAIEAFNKSGRKLKIVGSGPMLDAFKKKAKNNIEFLGEVSDRQLINLYQSSKALVFPGKEDFGLVMAEAITFGTPVVAYRGGGAKDIIKEGRNGELFDNQTAASLNASLERFEQKSYNKSDIIKSAELFSFENFRANFEKIIKSLIL